MSPPSEAFPESPRTPVRLAVPADGPALGAWLQACRPGPVIAARARRSTLDGLLRRPEQGACVVAERAASFVACLPISLIPHLGLDGLAAFAGEWWVDPAVSHEYGALFASCCEWTIDWCRAHGIRHLLLAPSLPVTGLQGFSQHDSGLWHARLMPAAKSLG